MKGHRAWTSYFFDVYWTERTKKGKKKPRRSLANASDTPRHSKEQYFTVLHAYECEITGDSDLQYKVSVILRCKIRSSEFYHFNIRLPVLLREEHVSKKKKKAFLFSSEANCRGFGVKRFKYYIHARLLTVFLKIKGPRPSYFIFSSQSAYVFPEKCLPCSVHMWASEADFKGAQCKLLNDLHPFLYNTLTPYQKQRKAPFQTV